MGEFPNPGTQFPPGKSGNPEGRPKGSLNWSTVVKKILEDEKLVDKVLGKKPGWWEELPKKDAAHGIVVAMAIKALSGDKDAAKWLRETGFGNKLDVTSDDKPLPTPILGVPHVPSDDSAAEAPSAD